MKNVEYWKPIKDFEGLYEISNLGRVKSLFGWNGRTHVPREKIMKSSISQNHYACVSLHKNKKQYRREIHRLVAEAFVPNPDGKPEVMHLDEDMYNNVATNLKWGTRVENINFPNCKRKQSEIAKKKIGDKNPFYGKHHSKETRAKLSKIKKEYYAKLKEGKYG